MILITIFITSFFISFLGSVQLGPVNLSVIYSVLQKGWKPALWLAVGGSIPEWIYSWLAIHASQVELLKQNSEWLQWLMVPLFFGVGLHTLFKKNSPPESTSFSRQVGGLAKGFLLAALNVQLFPFWLSIIVLLQGYGLTIGENLSTQLFFAAGAMLGALVLLTLIIVLTHRNKSFLLDFFSKYRLNIIFGYLFVAIAIIQIITLLMKQ